jgi:hypothetical protein
MFFNVYLLEWIYWEGYSVRETIKKLKKAIHNGYGIGRFKYFIPSIITFMENITEDLMIEDLEDKPTTVGIALAIEHFKTTADRKGQHKRANADKTEFNLWKG